MNAKAAGIAALALAVAVFLTLYRGLFGGVFAYLVPALAWGIVFGATLLVAGNDFIKKTFNRSTVLIGLSVAAIQIFLMIDVGLFSGFGRNPISSQPMTVFLSLILVGSTLAGIELSRSYVLKAGGNTRPALAIALVAVLYTFVYVAFYDVIFVFSFANPLFSVDFIGGTLIPVFTANLFVSFLSLLGGPLGAWAYMVPTYSLTWFSPILPDLPWGFKALLGVLPPLMGFIYINYVVTVRDFARAGVRIKINPRERAAIRKREKADRSEILGWAVVAAIGVSMVYFSVGLFPIYPVVPISGSMSPAFDVGDIVILQKVPVTSIKPGDVIEYLTAAAPVIHRVVSTENINGEIVLTTKGDANSVPDPAISEEQVRGKLMTVIPSIGWTSIYLKEFVIAVWGFITTSIGMVVMLSIALITTTYSGYRYKTQPRWRKLHRGGL